MTEHLTAKQYKEIAKAPKPSKYSAKRTKLDGHTFDSKREANRYAVLKQMQSNGFISDLELQPAFPLEMDGVCRVKTETGKTMRVTFDFAYTQNGKRVVEDAKGYKTRDYLVRKAVAEAFYGIKVVEV